jgi:hypothetical protein
MVMGALGLLATPSRHDRQPGQPAPGLIVRGLLGTVLLFILIGVNLGSDIIAHFGGFVGGIALGVSFSLLPEHCLYRGSISLVTGAITAATLVWTWALALANKP